MACYIHPGGHLMLLLHIFCLCTSFLSKLLSKPQVVMEWLKYKALWSTECLTDRGRHHGML